MKLKSIFAKRTVFVVLAVVVVAGGAALFLNNNESNGGHESAAVKDAQIWTCSMHPQVREPKPGKCPICGMALVPAGKPASTHDAMAGMGDKSASKNGGMSGMKGKTASRKIVSYKSTMMPGETSKTPRKDSMGMDMVPVYESGGPADAMLELSEHARAMASVETVPVQRKKMTREIRVVGKVQYNETALATITTRVEGYVERLFVDYTGVQVNQGDPLVEIYSPDLLVAQQELLVASEGQRNSNLAESAKRKLLLWGLTQEQVDDLMQNKKVHDRITLFSPVKGTVTEKMIVQKSMVKPGETLYRLANLESVWVYLDIYEYELAWVQKGQMTKVTSEALLGQSFTGRVWFISPVVSEETRTVKVLLHIDNTEHKLKPGMYVSAVIRAELLPDGKPAPTGVEGQWSCPMHPQVLQPQAGQCPICQKALSQIPDTPASTTAEAERLFLTVPASAVLDSGMRKLVYVEKSKGQFSPVEIVTGPRTEDSYPVLRGLNEGDKVAVRGGFLLDSQFQIRGLASLFYPKGQAAPAGHQGMAMPPSAAAKEKSGEGSKMQMPEHKR